MEAELSRLPLEVTSRAEESPIEAWLRAYHVAADAYLKEHVIDGAERESRQATHYAAIVTERIAVLEALLRLLPKEHEPTAELTHDIQRFFAETGVNLDTKSDNRGLPAIIPLEKPLLREP